MPFRKHPLNIGQLFDWHTTLSRQTVMYLDRPFDLAPEAGVRHGAEELARLVRDFSARLYAAGARAGDRVAVVKDNHYDVFLCSAAAARIGAVPAQLAGQNSPEAHRVMLERLDPKVLVTTPDVLAQAAAAGVKLVEPRVRVLLLGERDAVEEVPENTVTLAELAGAERAPESYRSPEQPQLIMHSSGTTGVPKLVVHSGETLLGGVAAMEQIPFPVVASKHNDVVGISVSFAHGRIASWTMGQFALAPRRLVMISRHELDVAARMIGEHRPTTLEACPNIFQYWEELADEKPDLFRQVRLYAGTFDAIHERTVRTFLRASGRRFPVWGQSWGQSEVGPMCIAVFTRGRLSKGGKKGGQDKAVTNSIGWTVPGLAKVKVVDPETGRTMPRGKPGIMMVASKGRCLDYLGESDRHAEKVRGRWWNTGDVGELGRFGELRLVDREVDIIPGMSGVELETLLLDRLPRASDVTVLGVPDGPPVPVLSMRDGMLDPQEWREATVGLPELAEPQLVPWHEVPRTATWKVRRLELRERVLGARHGVGTGRWT
ncbi:AMP-binding protein [Streptomyces sp. WMMC897]|uniref:AMP-binding protein n=1 Tax=Streptomyces sp. WMMC897 TaxID=3014782 RepID=UPI0022B656D3|nr:AMP-binding protein [Streptomyces sp. WMMC897]MCZ7414534.1 AMP-binding protein [Streptomyces sp. WMMC897]